MQASAVLAAPRDLVWSRLVDRDAVSGWLDDVDHLTSSPASPTTNNGTGSAFHPTGSPERFATRRAKEPCSVPIEGQVLAIERERRLRVVLRAPWQLLREIDLDLRLEPAEVGTILSVDATWHLSWLGWIVRPLVRLRADIALRRAARGFRAAVEDEAALRRRTTARPAVAERGPRRPSHDALLLRTAS